MRAFIRGPGERKSGAAWSLSIAAAVLALLSLALATYAAYRILSTRQDVWPSYSSGVPGIAPAPLLAVVAAVAVLLKLRHKPRALSGTW